MDRADSDEDDPDDRSDGKPTWQDCTQVEQWLCESRHLVAPTSVLNKAIRGVAAPVIDYVVMANRLSRNRGVCGWRSWRLQTDSSS